VSCARCPIHNCGLADRLRLDSERQQGEHDLVNDLRWSGVGPTRLRQIETEGAQPPDHPTTKTGWPKPAFQPVVWQPNQDSLAQCASWQYRSDNLLLRAARRTGAHAGSISNPSTSDHVFWKNRSSAPRVVAFRPVKRIMDTITATACFHYLH